MQFTAALASLFVALAIANPIAEPHPATANLEIVTGPAAREVLSSLTSGMERRSKLEGPAGPVYVCANQCVGGTKDPGGCFTNAACGKGGKCKTFCD